ncbi:cobalamin biosynthesis protein [Thiohalorhabdus methylotrophus]|uniref:Cobalamin biosynthesis protein n=1 Tax=Thiohalorhabdus methylotrophus TaxID=3242694 RepID=A0ABV4TT75_9GAMM
MIVLGVGFSARCDVGELVDLAQGVLERAGVEAGATGAVCMATLDRKRGDGLLEAAAERLGLEPRFLTADELATVREGVQPSARARAEVGVDSVAEAAALAAGGPGSRLVVGKTTSHRASCAASVVRVSG